MSQSFISQYLQAAEYVEPSLPWTSSVDPGWPCPAFSFNFTFPTYLYDPLRRYTSKREALVAISGALRFPD